MRTLRSAGSRARRGGHTNPAEPWGELCAGDGNQSTAGWALHSPVPGDAAALGLGRDSGTGQSSEWSWQRMGGDLLPSAKILLPSDVANQFTGVVRFVLSHNKPLIPGLQTDLGSVVLHVAVGQAGPLQQAGEGVRAALKNLCPAGHRKELSASKSCTRGIFPGQETCRRVKPVIWEIKSF